VVKEENLLMEEGEKEKLTTRKNKKYQVNRKEKNLLQSIIKKELKCFFCKK